MGNLRRNSEDFAFWLAPLAATAPLIPVFSLPWPTLFLGKLMGDTSHPFLQPHWGPWLAATAVVFDGTVLAYFTAVLLYVFLRASGQWPATRLSAIRIMVLFSLAGVLASQFVNAVQGFRQPRLREFAGSWLSPLFGCLCGLASGWCFALLAKRRFPPAARVMVYAMPVVILLVCGGALVWSAHVWKAHLVSP